MTIKVVEQSGIPLAMSFVPKFKNLNGCPRGQACKLCKENDGLECSKKCVVYKATCLLCGNHENSPAYIGETSRPYRERILEHNNNLKNWKTDSFQLLHWMQFHGTETSCPQFKFEVVKRFVDPLRRQLSEGLIIIKSGTMNKKLEYNHNRICRMEASEGPGLSEKALRSELWERQCQREMIQNFVIVMSSLNKFERTALSDENTIGLSNVSFQNCSRLNNFTPVKEDRKRKRALMETSTPVNIRRESVMIHLDEDSPIGLQGDSEMSIRTSSTSSQNVGDGTNRAGISNDLDGAVITPPRAESSSTQDLNMWGGAGDLSAAAMNSGAIPIPMGGAVELELGAVKNNSLFNGFGSRVSGLNGSTSAELELLNLSPWEECDLTRNNEEGQVLDAPGNEENEVQVLRVDHILTSHEVDNIKAQVTGADHMLTSHEVDNIEAQVQAPGSDHIQVCFDGNEGHDSGAYHIVKTHEVDDIKAQIRVPQDDQIQDCLEGNKGRMSGGDHILTSQEVDNIKALMLAPGDDHIQPRHSGKLVLGVGADLNLLNSRALPDGTSPKRSLHVSPSTPKREEKRRFLLSDQSPTLRLRFDKKKKTNTPNWLDKLRQDKLMSPGASGSNSKASTRGGSRGKRGGVRGRGKSTPNVKNPANSRAVLDRGNVQNGRMMNLRSNEDLNTLESDIMDNDKSKQV